MELPAAGGDRGLVQQGAVQGEGRLPARRHAEEDPLSHLAVSEGESGQAGDSIPPPPAPGGILWPSGAMSVCTLHSTSCNYAFYCKKKHEYLLIYFVFFILLLNKVLV